MKIYLKRNTGETIELGAAFTPRLSDFTASASKPAITSINNISSDNAYYSTSSAAAAAASPASDSRSAVSAASPAGTTYLAATAASPAEVAAYMRSSRRK